MAAITTVREFSKEIVNVSLSVGNHGINHQNDVMLVKGFLWYIAEKVPSIAPPGGIPLPYEGTTANVAQAIINFQTYYNDNNKKYGKAGRVAVDGRISPLSGNSKYINGKKHFWTIYALNVYVDYKAKIEGKGSGREAVVEIFPHLGLLFP